MHILINILIKDKQKSIFVYIKGSVSFWLGLWKMRQIPI